VGAAEQDDEPAEALELRVLHEVPVFINVRFVVVAVRLTVV
jgi:hypothetical protein